MTKGNLKSFISWSKETKNVDIEELWKEYNIRPTITVDELLQYVAHLFNLNLTQLKYSKLRAEHAGEARGIIIQCLTKLDSWSITRIENFCEEVFNLERTTVLYWRKERSFNFDPVIKDKYLLIKKFITNKEVL